MSKRIELLTSVGFISEISTYKKLKLKDIIDTRDLERIEQYYQDIYAYNLSIPIRCFIKNDQGQIKQASCISFRDNEQIKSLWTFDDSQGNDLLAAAAHDLRSPINSILGLTSVLHIMLKEENLDKKELSQIANLIKISCNNALDFTADLLELSEIESGNYHLHTEDISVNDFINNFISTNRLATLRKQISVQMTSSLPDEVTFCINRSKISRVLSNLLSNAVKFTPQGGKINLKVLKSDQGLEIHLIDHGIGMSKKIMDNLFVRFGQSKRSGLDGEVSHGLGMTIVKQIMELHHGEIQVTSKEDIGTTIKLIFTT